MRPSLERAVRLSPQVLRPREPVVTVLGYHRVADDGDRLAVGSTTFEQQMSILDNVRDELPTLALDDTLRRLADGSAPPRSVVVTFDDAWSDIYGSALDVLLAHRIPATLYVPTGRLDHRGHVSRSELLALAAAGIAIGGHTRTHPDLRTCTESELDYEIAGGRADLEDLLGAPVDSFAYPGGLHDEKVVAAVSRAGFRSAVTTRPGWLKRGSDPLRIRRGFVEEMAPATFRAGLRGGLNVLAGVNTLMAGFRRVRGRREAEPLL
jgi:peptidoglycan/xylan/chitin deacetylase (PgdA/CDA1 family)